MAEVDILIRAEDEASAALAKVATRLNDVGVAAGETAVTGKQVGTGIETGARQGEQAAESLNKSFGELKATMVEALALWGAKETIEGILRFGEAGAELINVAQGFDRITTSAGLSASAVEESFAAAADGVMMTDDILKEFNLTANATGAEIASSFPDLIRGAMAIAAQGIGDTQRNLELLDSYIRTGFGRGIKMQLGLVLPDQPAIMDAYAASLGKTAAQLTELEQAQARAQAVTDALKAKYGDLQTASEQLAGAGIARLKTAVGELTEYVERQAAPTIDRYADAVARVLTLGVSQLPGNTGYSGSIMADLDALQKGGGFGSEAEAVERRLGVAAGDTAGAYGRLAQAIDVTALSSDELMAIQERFAAVMDDMTFASLKAVAAFDDRARAIEANRRVEAELAAAQHSWQLLDAGAVARDTAELARYTAVFRDLVGVVQDFVNIGDVTGQFGKINDALAAYDKAINGGGPPSQGDYANTPAGRLEWGAAMVTYFTDTYLDGVRKQSDAETDFTNQRTQNWDTLKGKLDTYFATYNSAVAGLLTPTTTSNGPSADEMLAATGQRKDAWDESNRRAQDIFLHYGEATKASWFAGWAAQVEFPVGAGEDEARAWAARYSKEFEMFQHPEDINWDALRQQFGDLVDTQLGKQQVIATLKDQLSAGGLGPDNPEVMQAFDFTGLGTSGGGDMASAFMASFTSANWAGAGQGIVAKIAQGASTGNAAMLQALAGDLWAYIRPLVNEEMKNR